MSTRSSLSRRRLVWVGLAAVFFSVALGFLLRLHRSTHPQPNVLWITMDSLRADHLGCSGYQRAHTPNIDLLARQGVLFTQSISQATYTHISVPSMITSKYPMFTGVRTAGMSVDSSHSTLAELLRDDGYFTHGIVMSWNDSFNQGFERLDPADRSTKKRTRLCLETLDELDGRPFFIWLYYWDPHLPYDPPVEFMRAFEPEYTKEKQRPERRPSPAERDQDLRDETGHYAGIINVLARVNQGQIALSQAEREHLINLYDAEIAFVDSKIKEVMDEINELGLWNNTMVVLNADHGEAFGEHGLYYHGNTIYEEEVRVPLIIKAPRSEAAGKIIHGPVRNLDIMPTILDYCGVSSPKDLNGRSLRPFIEKDLAPNLPTSLETFGCWKGVGSELQIVGYRRDGYKLTCDLVGGRVELYHLEDDPLETNDLLANREIPPRVKRQEAELGENLLKCLGVGQLADLKLSFWNQKMDQATKQRLKALGYIY